MPYTVIWLCVMWLSRNEVIIMSFFSPLSMNPLRCLSLPPTLLLLSQFSLLLFSPSLVWSVGCDCMLPPHPLMRVYGKVMTKPLIRDHWNCCLIMSLHAYNETIFSSKVEIEADSWGACLWKHVMLSCLQHYLNINHLIIQCNIKFQTSEEH